MKGKWNGYVIITVLFLMSLTMLSILPNNKDIEVMSTFSESEYSQELATFFPNKINFTWFYAGIAEYGHMMTLHSIEEREKTLVLKIKGNMADAAGGQNRYFLLTYSINHDSVIERVENHDYFYKGPSNTLRSIIPNQRLLKLPLKVGNHWEESFTYNDKDYIATTIISEVNLSKEGRKTIMTETIVKGVDNYPDNTYIEKKVFIEGIGLYSFHNTRPYYIDANGNKSTYEFSYYLNETFIQK